MINIIKEIPKIYLNYGYFLGLGIVLSMFAALIEPKNLTMFLIGLSMYLVSIYPLSKLR